MMFIKLSDVYPESTLVKAEIKVNSLKIVRPVNHVGCSRVSRN